jgi:dienelactone hydrolase
MNEASSRSHAILMLTIARSNHEAERIGAELFIVDLAGSERLKRSGATGMQLSEAVAINQSLLALANVTQALVENNGRPRSHIPYRDSALTRLLQNSLGGRARTALIACISPAADSSDETHGALRFAACATFVQNCADKVEKEAGEHAAEEQLEVFLADKAVEFLDGRASIPTNGSIINCYGDFSAGPDAAVVVLLHYYGKEVDASMWASTFESLKLAGKCYLAPDMPGHGGSLGECSAKPDDYGKDGGPADIILHLLNACGVRRACLFGYDWGGGIACAFALKHPTRTQKLIAWCASFPERCYGERTDKQKLQRKSRMADVLLLWAKRDSWHPWRRGQDLADAIGTRIVEVRLRHAGGLDDAMARLLEFV